jgi:hypothetical protein
MIKLGYNIPISELDELVKQMSEFGNAAKNLDFE